MDEIHMGQLLKKVIRRKGRNITELATALNITRRTLYNWFKQEMIDEAIMQRISSFIVYDFDADTRKLASLVKSTMNRQKNCQKSETTSIGKISTLIYWNVVQSYLGICKKYKLRQRKFT